MTRLLGHPVGREAAGTPGVIVYYVVGPVHPLNLEVLVPHLPGWSFRITYEPHVPWFAHGELDALPFAKVPLEGDLPPEALWEGDVRAVVFSTLQPRPGPVNLLQSALKRRVPTIAIQEGNQLALNHGTVNNYVLPVDHVLAASACERQGLIDAGICAQRVTVTGWPFHAGRTGRPAVEELRAAKQELGLDPLRPVASLTLTPLGVPMEGPVERRRQLTLAAQGLTPDSQLVIKPHPVEALDVLMPFVEECAPRARALEPTIPIGRLLDATDVLINRGTSQVCIEALHRQIPVFIIDIGVQTPFHELASDIVIRLASDLRRCLSRHAAERDFIRVYDRFKQVHMPFSPLDAKRRTCRQIVAIAGGAGRRPPRADQRFELALCQAWINNRTAALELLASSDLRQSGKPTAELSRLARYQASVADLNRLQQAVTPAFWAHVLRCLWIDQRAHRGEAPTDADLEWMHDFPPDLDVYWFADHVRKWLGMLPPRHGVPAVSAWTDRLRTRFTHVPAIAAIVADTLD